MNKTFLKSLAAWLGLTGLVLWINIYNYMKGNWWLAIGLTPLSLLLLSVPFIGQKMNEFVTEATLHYQQYNLFGKKKY